MNQGFKEQSNYLVGFLAVIVGLAFFKDGIAHINVQIFSFYPTLLNLAVFVLAWLLFAAYLGALTHLVGSFNITRFPISGYMSILTSVATAIALISPLLMFSAWGLTHLPFERLKSTEASSIGTAISLLLGFVLGFTSSKNEKRELAQNATTIVYPQTISEEPVSEKPSPKRQARLNESAWIGPGWVGSYESLVEFMSNYLYLRGYGVKGRGLAQLAELLNDKGVLSDSDLRSAKKVADLRNQWAHSGTPVSRVEVEDAQETLLDLYKKTQKAYLDYLGVGAGRFNGKAKK
jgi:hypothetical protein